MGRLALFSNYLFSNQSLRPSSGAELPFPVTDNLVDAEFLIGGNRPIYVIHKIPVKVRLIA